LKIIKNIYNKGLAIFNKHEIIRNFSAVFSVDVLVRASGFLLLPVYLKLMPQYDYGMFNYILTIAGIFVAILNFGLNISQGKMYFGCETEKQKGELLFTINVLLIIFLAVSLFIIYFFKIDYWIIDLKKKKKIPYNQYRSIIILIIVASIYSIMLTNFFVTTKSIKHIQIFNILRFILSNGIVIFLLYISNTETVFIRLKYNYLVEMFIVFVFSVFYIRKMEFKFNLKYATKSLKIGLPYMMAAVPGIIIIFTDKFYVEKFSNFTQLSVYYLAVTIASVITIISSSLQMVWLPYFFNEKNADDNLRRTKRLIKILIILLISISFLLILVSKLLLIFNIFGNEYSSIMYILPLLLVSQVINSICFIYQNYLIYHEKTEYILAINLFLLAPSILLTRFFTGYYGITGAALAFLILVIISWIIYYYVFIFYKKRANLKHG